MRTTPQSLNSQITSQIGRHTAELGRLQEQISSGKRVTRPSDDPAAMRTITIQRLRHARLDTEIANIRDATSKLNMGVSQLLDAGNSFTRAKELAMDGVQAFDPSARQAMSIEVDALIERVLLIANTENDGRALFAGADADVRPFVADGVPPTSVRYDGSATTFTVDVGSGNAVDVISPGQEIFGGDTDAFDTLIKLRDTLRNDAGLSESELAAELETSIADIDTVHDRLLHNVGQQSAVLSTLRSLDSRAEDLQLEVELAISDYESVDLAEAAVRLAETQNLLEFTFASSQRLLSLNLADRL